MTLHSLPVFLRLHGRAVILVGTGEAAAAKRRLLERAGAVVVDEDAPAAPAPPGLAIVVDDDAAVARLKARGLLVNAVDRPDLCDFTLPAIVERGAVIVAVGTGGASAGLAAALRQRLEGWLSPKLGTLAARLHVARADLRRAFPDADARRRAIARALAPGGVLDIAEPDVADDGWLDRLGSEESGAMRIISLASPDPDDLTLRDARLLAFADRVYHPADAPPAILHRARADAARIAGPAPSPPPPGLSVVLEWAR